MTKPLDQQPWVQGVALFVADTIKVATEPLQKEIDKLRARVAELETSSVLKYSGVYQKALQYKRGDAVTFDGSLHIAVADVKPGEMPMQSPAWQLAVKIGRDA